jgi:hypothetical protein
VNAIDQLLPPLSRSLVSATTYRKVVARRRAAAVVAMVAATMLLEGQRLDAQQRQLLLQDTYRKLLRR